MHLKFFDLEVMGRCPENTQIEFDIVREDFNEAFRLHLEDNPPCASDTPAMLIGVIDAQFETIGFEICAADQEGKPIEVLTAIQPVNILETATSKVLDSYLDVCDKYYEIVRTGLSDKIQAIDTQRRGLHNEGANKILSYLKNQGFEGLLDFDQARSIFTLFAASEMAKRQLLSPDPAPENDDFIARPH